jgi:cytoskeletal protein CcmA (bactofilin family)
MWNKRSEEEGRAKTQQPQPQPGAQAQAAQAPAAAPRPAPPEPPRGVAILGKNVQVKGEIHSKEDLTIDGDVQGTVEADGHRLTIGPNGKLQANGVKAREVIVMGKMNGSVLATEKVYIRKDAQLVGDVQTAGIVIEDGAYFKGGIDIKKPG